MQAALDVINAVIPATASAVNQLTDRDFVNSSISTSTATFRGTVADVAALPTSGVDINDYAFVVSVDASGNTVYNRYKYDGDAWAFEYALNNSSFTAEQWASIQSGITAESVAQIATNKGSIDSEVAARESADTALDGKVALKAEISPSNGDASALREMYVAAGAEYDANAKTYTFGGIEGLSETQMRQAFVSSLELVKNKVTTVSANCTDTEYPTAKAAYEAKKLLFIDEVSCWGMQYNSETGFFEYHGMTDITYEQALYAYTITSQAGQGRILDNCFHGIETLRFNFAPLGYDSNVWVNSNFGEFAYCANLEQYNTNDRGYHLVMERMFKGCKKLRKIETISFVAGNSITANAFEECTALEEFDFRLTKNDMNFADSPLIKLPCIVNLINNISTTLISAITITLENSVYSKAIADNDIINALALQPMAQLASA
jgi:hypothetical protein